MHHYLLTKTKKEKMHMKHFFSVMLLLCVCIYAQAQERTITGTVTESDNKQSVPGVAVTVKGTTIGVITIGRFGCGQGCYWFSFV